MGLYIILCDRFYFVKGGNYYTLYESTPSSKRTIIKFLKGEILAKGRLPIALKHI